MGVFLINKMKVNMSPLFDSIKSNAEKFKIEDSNNLDIDIYIRCERNEYNNLISKNDNLSLDDAEKIITSSQFTNKVIEYNSIVLHASAVLFEDKAYLFSANSKVGKTTHTKLWQEYFGKDKAIIINDDKPVINTSDDKILVYGSPWSGNSSECENISAEIGAIVFLEQGKENKLICLDKQEEILPLLLEQTVHRVSVDKMNKILDTLSVIVTNCKFYKLMCNMDIESVEESKKIII